MFYKMNKSITVKVLRTIYMVFPSKLLPLFPPTIIPYLVYDCFALWGWEEVLGLFYVGAFSGSVYQQK